MPTSADKCAQMRTSVHSHEHTFFFNEINRARPQVHSLMLRAMAERSVTAFNKEYRFPHLQVFADRNRIEKEETFEISSAAKDRFLMEISIETPNVLLRDESTNKESIVYFYGKNYDDFRINLTFLEVD